MSQKIKSTKRLTLAVMSLLIVVNSVGLVVYTKSDNQTLKKAQQNLQASQTVQATELNSGININDPKSYADYKKPNESELRSLLSPVQYDVTQQDGTEKPFNNPLWDNKAEGIYVDILSGEPLYSSVDKYDSGTGWPSFTRPLNPDNIVLKDDSKFVIKRTETRSKHADNHLGHVFDDGPTTLEASGGASPTGLRYCMNSAALEFIPKTEMKERGYSVYLPILTAKAS